MNYPDNRVLIIGLDSATWDVLGPWIADGTLPHLARLKSRGRWGVLRSTIPPVTAAAWSTFITGKRPGKHGVFHFINLFGEEGVEDRNQLVNAETVKSPAIWDVLGHHHRLVGLINIPLTYPPRPVNGFMITGLLTPGHARVFTYPPDLSDSIGDYQIDLERFADKTPYQDEFSTEITRPDLEFLREFNSVLEKRARVTFDLIGSRRWDFFMVVFTEPDRLGHYFWKYHGSANPSSDNPGLTEGVWRFYMRLDEIVGELVERAGKGTTVLVASDHGMGPVPRNQIHIGNWFQQQGWLATQAAKGGLAAPDTLLSSLGISRDQVGRVVKRWFPSVLKTSWMQKAIHRRAWTAKKAASQAFPVPICHNIIGIRLNREKGPGNESFREEIVQRLRNISDPKTGKGVITEVISGRDYYSGPYSENVPDLIAIADPDYNFNHSLGFYSGIVTPRQGLAGPARHRMEGVFMAVGNEIEASADPLPTVSLEDIAPTVLHLMGLPVPSDLDGRVVTELFSQKHLQARPVAFENPRGYWPDASKVEFGDRTMSAEDEAVLQNQLRALGYLD